MKTKKQVACSVIVSPLCKENCQLIVYYCHNLQVKCDLQEDIPPLRKGTRRDCAYQTNEIPERCLNKKAQKIALRNTEAFFANKDNA